jgi:hypothetical protein
MVCPLLRGIFAFTEMTFDKLYDTLRVILGDRQVHGNWNYTNTQLDSAIKSVFLLGRGPTPFSLNVAQDEITPDFDPQRNGDQFALTCYEAVLLTVGGEDGAYRLQTRAVNIADGGDRKRDLIRELGLLVYEIRNGGAVFTSHQQLSAWLSSFTHNENPLFARGSEVNVTPGPNLSL